MENKVTKTPEEVSQEAYEKTLEANKDFRNGLSILEYSKRINEIAEWHRKELALLIK